MPASPASMTASRSAATSRRPRFKPCAPMGGNTWAASPTSARRGAVNRSTDMPVIGKVPRGAVDLHGTQNGLRLTLDPRGKIAVAKPGQGFGFVGTCDPDKARPAAGQGNQRERAVPGVELRRSFSMGPVMSEDRRDGGLRIGPPPRLDPDALPELGVAPVRRDAELRLKDHAAFQPDDRMSAFVLDPRRLAVEQPEPVLVARDLALEFRRGRRFRYSTRKRRDRSPRHEKTPAAGGRGCRYRR